MEQTGKCDDTRTILQLRLGFCSLPDDSIDGLRDVLDVLGIY